MQLLKPHRVSFLWRQCYFKNAPRNEFQIFSAISGDIIVVELFCESAQSGVGEIRVRAIGFFSQSLFVFVCFFHSAIACLRAIQSATLWRKACNIFFPLWRIGMQTTANFVFCLCQFVFVPFLIAGVVTMTGLLFNNSAHI